MQASELAADAIGRIRELVHSIADGLDTDQLATQPAPGSNSIGWILWHLTRVQDAQVGELFGDDQLWVTDGFAAELGFPPDRRDHGYGQTAEQAAAVRISRPEVLLAYHDAVATRSLSRLETTAESDLDRIVDESFTPAVTAGVRLVSVIDDSLQHIGAAGYLRGLLGF